MKTNSARRSIALILALCMVLVLVFAACDPDEKCTTHVDLDGDGKCDVCGVDMPKPVTISITAEKDTINYDETLPVTVTVENAEDKTYTVSYSEEGVVTLSNGVISVVNPEMTLDKFVVITVTATADKNATASLPITVKAPVQEGQVGELTSDMLVALGNSSITATGVVTDYYIDHNQPFNSYNTAYDMTVKMGDGKWYGEWNAQGSADVISDLYVKGEDVVGSGSSAGHALESVFINKDNQLDSKQVTDYLSDAVTWESQHYWNHLGQLNINKFSYDAENEVYRYDYDKTSKDDLYLLTYLVYSLTPMMADTFDSLYLTVENGVVTGMVAQTAALSYPEGMDDPDYTTYTTVQITFSDVGTTTVPTPAPYEASENTEILADALAKMAEADSYVFHSVDTQQSAPSGDAGDYEIASASTRKNAVLGNTTSSTGTVGLQGWVTADTVLLCETGKYAYAMDNKLYHLEYYGYKQIDGTYYDEFAYSSADQAYVGTKRVEGVISDVLPGFQVSANLFTFTGTSTSGGKTVYNYVLQENRISRDVAMELGIYNAEDSVQSVQSNFTISATEDGIVQVKYPYSLVDGLYVGYVTTSYSDVGTATMPMEGLFDNYVERKVPTSWAETQTKYYSPDCSSDTSYEAPSDVAFKDAFGTKYDSPNFPQFTAFFNVFGDNVSGPFYNYTEKSNDGEGNIVWKKYVSINIQVYDYDENMQISRETYDAYMSKLAAELGKLGFTRDAANTDTTNNRDKVESFVNAELGIQIKVENTGTSYFYIDILNAGDFILNR